MQPTQHKGALLTFSSECACRLGLEESILYQTLIDLMPLFTPDSPLTTQKPCSVPRSALTNRLKFWQLLDIQRLLSSLSNQGVITLISPPLTQTEQLIFLMGKSLSAQIIRPASQRAIRPPPQNPQNKALPMSPSWKPNRATQEELQRRGIDQATLRREAENFVRFYCEKAETAFNWNQRFLKWVIRDDACNKVRFERQRSAFEQLIHSNPVPMRSDWKPDSEAVDILLRDQVHFQFIEDAIPEFILYWQERGEVHKTWSSKFIQHVREQWIRFQGSVQHSQRATPIPNHWVPGEEVFDILQLANIDRDFAETKVQEFVLYWRDSGKVHSSWNSKFLQYIKSQWSQKLHHHDQAAALASHHSAAANAPAQLADTSWAD